MKCYLSKIGLAGVIVVLIILATSCVPEKKLARSFVSESRKRNALLLSTDIVFKKSLKKSLLDSLEITDEALFDSVLMANSDLLQYVDDSLFIQNFLAGYEKELRLFNFNIYRESQTASFLEVDTNAYVIYLAQLELEESYFPFRDETLYLDNYYYHDHLLNSATVYSWFEINEVDKEEPKQVYFAEDAIADEVDGDFAVDYFGGEIKYFYRIDSLQPGDMYNYAFTLGRKYAGYTFDLLMNKYIAENMEGKPRYYLRYDPFYKNFFEATDDRFILLDTE